MPPIWVTSGHPETLGRAIRDNHNLFVTALLNGLDAVKALRERLEGIAAKEGRSIDDVRFGFLRCGYASEFSFSRAFKRTFGVAPGAYRADPAASARPLAVTTP